MAEAPLLMLGLVALLLYLGAVQAGRRRGRSWPIGRTLAWVGGVLCSLAATTGPVAAAAGHSFVAHMVSHLMLAMVAPLLLVLGAPVRLSLRALPVRDARRLSRVLQSPVPRLFAHPVPAGLLSVGGLWVVYGTPLFGWTQVSGGWHLTVQVHLLVSGYLFTAAVIGTDPTPHRATVGTRSAVVVIALAAHGILAKLLYAHPPAGVGAEDGRRGALLMFYGGDLVEVVVVVVLGLQWYRRTAPAGVGITSAAPHAGAA